MTHERVRSSTIGALLSQRWLRRVSFVGLPTRSAGHGTLRPLVLTRGLLLHTHQFEKQFISVCAPDGGDTLPQIQLAGCLGGGGVGELEIHLPLLFRIFSKRQGASHTPSVCRFDSTLRGARKAG